MHKKDENIHPFKNAELVAKKNLLTTGSEAVASKNLRWPK